MNYRLKDSFFSQDIQLVAPKLIGKIIVRTWNNKAIKHFRITDIEMYIGEQDLACHASKGRTNRTKMMYAKGGCLYVYLIYGIHWLLNFVTGQQDQPQAILIRGVTGCSGPGRVSKLLDIDKSFYGENLVYSQRIWLEDDNKKYYYTKHPRVNVDYAGDVWKNKPFRFILKHSS